MGCRSPVHQRELRRGGSQLHRWGGWRFAPAGVGGRYISPLSPLYLPYISAPAGVVHHRVVEDQVEVAHEGRRVGHRARLHPTLKCCEVHRVLDVLFVVGRLLVRHLVTDSNRQSQAVTGSHRQSQAVTATVRYCPLLSVTGRLKGYAHLCFEMEASSLISVPPTCEKA